MNKLNNHPKKALDFVLPAEIFQSVNKSTQ